MLYQVNQACHLYTLIYCALQFSRYLMNQHIDSLKKKQVEGDNFYSTLHESISTRRMSMFFSEKKDKKSTNTSSSNKRNQRLHRKSENVQVELLFNWQFT